MRSVRMTSSSDDHSGDFKMIHPYDPIYKDKAQNTLGNMLDYAVYSLHQNAPDFFDLFIASGISALFESGDIRTIVGMSGAELACRIMELSGVSFERVRPRFTTGKSKEFVCGAVMARLQWQTGKSFTEILSMTSPSEIISMYEQHTLEVRRQLAEIWPPVMDAAGPEETARRLAEAIAAITDSIHEKMSSASGETHLKSIRLSSGMSQSRLAKASGVPLRTIQQYEQRQKSINKAQSEYLIRLAGALHCDPSQLLE